MPYPVPVHCAHALCRTLCPCTVPMRGIWGCRAFGVCCRVFYRCQKVQKTMGPGIELICGVSVIWPLRSADLLGLLASEPLRIIFRPGHIPLDHWLTLTYLPPPMSIPPGTTVPPRPRGNRCQVTVPPPPPGGGDRHHRQRTNYRRIRRRIYDRSVACCTSPKALKYTLTYMTYRDRVVPCE